MMKRLSFLGLLVTAMVSLAGCPIWDDSGNNECRECSGVGGSPAYECTTPDECTGINQVCGADKQCHTGDCGTWDCPVGYTCDAGSDQKLHCIPEGNTGGTGGSPTGTGGSGGVSTGGSSSGGSSTGGSSAGGSSTGGSSAGGSSTGGAGGAGGGTGGSSTGGAGGAGGGTGGSGGPGSAGTGGTSTSTGTGTGGMP